VSAAPGRADRAAEAAEAVARLDEVTRRLRRECPWDREQDERSIVPHTVEEAYELADAAASGDDAKLLDELGDVLFQVHFLALLLEERGAGSLAAVADGCREKLVRRHPHVFGEAEAATAAEVRENWDEIKRTREGRGDGDPFADLPENLPALLYARKSVRRGERLRPSPVPDEVLRTLGASARRIADGGTRDELEAAAGDALLALVELTADAGVDPELSLRAATRRRQAEIGEDGALRG
jgi:nucleoside triphosphate diphosphatase